MHVAVAIAVAYYVAYLMASWQGGNRPSPNFSLSENVDSKMHSLGIEVLHFGEHLGAKLC